MIRSHTGFVYLFALISKELVFFERPDPKGWHNMLWGYHKHSIRSTEWPNLCSNGHWKRVPEVQHTGSGREVRVGGTGVVTEMGRRMDQTQVGGQQHPLKPDPLPRPDIIAIACSS